MAVNVTLASTLLLPSGSAFANKVEGAFGYYTDNVMNLMLTSMQGVYDRLEFFDGPGTNTALSLGYTGKIMQFKEPGDLLEKQLKGEERISQNSVSLAVDQGLAVGTTVGVLGGLTQSPLTSVRYVGLRAGQWWLSETLQTTLEYRSTEIGQNPLDYTDTDGKRILTPQDLDGSSYSLGLTHFTTPSTILLASYSLSKRSDRPDAWTGEVEVRQHLNVIQAAVYGAYLHYENVGTIEAITSYGSVVGNQLRAEYHQRLRRRFILSAGYRYHTESDNPRAEGSSIQQLGTDTIFSSLRWRLGRGVWTSETHEIYGFLSRYSTNQAIAAYMVGFGGQYIL